MQDGNNNNEGFDTVSFLLAIFTAGIALTMIIIEIAKTLASSL